MDIRMWWPIALIVFSNVFYNICSKQTPEGIHPLAALTVTYLVAAVASGIEEGAGVAVSGSDVGTAV